MLATGFLSSSFVYIKAYVWYVGNLDQVVPAVNFIIKPGQAPASELFWVFYFIATPLHALHLLIGIGLLFYVLGRARRGDLTPAYFAPLEVVGLYWALSIRF